MVVRASMSLIVVDVGVEVREVAVQVHSVCIVPANQVSRNVCALAGKCRNEKGRFQAGSYIRRTLQSFGEGGEALIYQMMQHFLH